MSMAGREGEQATRERTGPGYSRLARDADRRLLAGVCTGLGRYTGIDPVVFRVGFAILVLAHGQGILLYIAAALLMPASPGESSLAEQLFKRWFDAQAVLSILGALLCVGVALSLFGGAYTDTIAVMVVFGLVLVVAHSRGADLVGAARSVPERLAGHPPEPSAAWARPAASGGVSFDKDVPEEPRAGGGLPAGMIDLAEYSAARAGAPAEDVRTAAKADRTACGKRGRSPAAAITLLAAMAAGAALIPVANGYPAPDSWLIVMAPALAVVGLGLVVGGWFRTRGLATAGTVLTLSMLTTTVAGDMPRNAEYGAVDWRPTDMSQTNQVYKVGVGQGDLDLTALPIAPGQRVTIDAQVLLGGLAVTLPPGARVTVDARIALGDLRVQNRTTSGPNARLTQVLEPEKPGGNPPLIELRIRGKVGDVDVTRG
ncbi:PspC domain-containing protein [Actinomadura sp. NAK00032]|uniref:PspC domain-containing protein n=1 Tax=Actinomadura sp. NAK00032 TaxID=2742128 RepID=UPI0015920497|nr:PspC domain-containing protein [Actinomadura sp. NAK00032]QKW39201.1 PspC domain-containing protein [Actinomadura sp. NAK00032]